MQDKFHKHTYAHLPNLHHSLSSLFKQMYIYCPRFMIQLSFCCFVYLLRHLHQPVSYLIQLRFVHTFLFYFFKSALSRLHYISIHHTIFFYLLSHSCGFSFGPFLSSFFRTNGQQLDNYMPIIGSYLYSFLCLDYVYFRCSCTLMYLIKK